jgi:hypothetical protein
VLLLLLLLLLLRGRLVMMLLVNDARGSRMLQMRRNRTLLLVMRVVLRVMAGLFLELAWGLAVVSHCQSHRGWLFVLANSGRFTMRVR